MNDTQPVSIRLERGKSVKWHDGTQWRIGHLLIPGGDRALVQDCVGDLYVVHANIIQPHIVGQCYWYKLVHTCAGVFAVESDALEYHPPRCERCGVDWSQPVEYQDLESGQWFPVVYKAEVTSGEYAVVHMPWVLHCTRIWEGNIHRFRNVREEDGDE